MGKYHGNLRVPPQCQPPQDILTWIYVDFYGVHAAVHAASQDLWVDEIKRVTSWESKVPPQSYPPNK